MKFNENEFKVLDIGNNNLYTKHAMNGSELSKVSHERDFGATISKELKSSKHCSDVVKTAKCFRSKEAKHFPFNRMVNIWIFISVQIVNSNTIESF